MDAFIPALLATATTLLTVAGAYWTARKYGKMGGGVAQLRLNDTLEATMQAQATELGSLRRQLDDAQRTILDLARDFKACKDRLINLERLVADRALAEDAHRAADDVAKKRFRDDTR